MGFRGGLDAGSQGSGKMKLRCAPKFPSRQPEPETLVLVDLPAILSQELVDSLKNETADGCCLRETFAFLRARLFFRHALNLGQFSGG